MIEQHIFIICKQKLRNIAHIQGEINVFLVIFMKKGFKIAILRFWPSGAVLGAANRQKCENFIFFVFFSIFMYKCTKLGGPHLNQNFDPQNHLFAPTPSNTMFEKGSVEVCKIKGKQRGFLKKHISFLTSNCRFLQKTAFKNINISSRYDSFCFARNAQNPISYTATAF